MPSTRAGGEEQSCKRFVTLERSTARTQQSKVTAIYLRAAIGLLSSECLASHPLPPKTTHLRVTRRTSPELPEDEDDEQGKEEDHVYARLNRPEVGQLLEALSNAKHRLVWSCACSTRRDCGEPNW